MVMDDLAEADASGAKAAGTAVMAFSKSRRPRDRGSGFGVRGSGTAESSRSAETSLFLVSAIMSLKGSFQSSVFSHQLEQSKVEAVKESKGEHSTSNVVFTDN